jgi:two-component system sensor histidine kinase KdpD
LTVSIPETLPPVLADAVLLDIVVTNLLDNVAVHTADDVPVSIRASAADDGMVELVVEDQGSGVPAAVLPRLFERFRRATPRPEGSRRGLGIGLSVVRGLVEAMGGQVTAASGRSGGLAVTVSLRQAPADPER